MTPSGAKRMRGEGPYAWQIGRRFEIAAKRLGINLYKRRLRTDLFAATPGERAIVVVLANSLFLRNSGRETGSHFC